MFCRRLSRVCAASGRRLGAFSSKALRCLALRRARAYDSVLMNIAPKSSFVLNRPHSLGIAGLSREEITGPLDLSEEFVDLNRRIEKKTASLRGRTLVNLFFDVSTRTQASFEPAGKRLGAGRPPYCETGSPLIVYRGRLLMRPCGYS